MPSKRDALVNAELVDTRMSEDEADDDADNTSGQVSIEDDIGEGNVLLKSNEKQCRCNDRDRALTKKNAREKKLGYEDEATGSHRIHDKAGINSKQKKKGRKRGDCPHEEAVTAPTESGKEEVSSGEEAEIPKCPICFEPLTDPVILDCKCQYELCEACFKTQVGDYKAECPQCRQRLSAWLRREARAGHKSLVNQARKEEVRIKLLTKQHEETGVKERNKVAHILAEPGEIRKEYEKEKLRLIQERERQARNAEELSKLKIRELNERDEYEAKISKFDETLREMMFIGFTLEEAQILVEQELGYTPTSLRRPPNTCSSSCVPELSALASTSACCSRTYDGKDEEGSVRRRAGREENGRGEDSREVENGREEENIEVVGNNSTECNREKQDGIGADCVENLNEKGEDSRKDENESIVNSKAEVRSQTESDGIGEETIGEENDIKQLTSQDVIGIYHEDGSPCCEEIIPDLGEERRDEIYTVEEETDAESIGEERDESERVEESREDKVTIEERSNEMEETIKEGEKIEKRRDKESVQDGGGEDMVVEDRGVETVVDGRDVEIVVEDRGVEMVVEDRSEIDRVDRSIDVRDNIQEGIGEMHKVKNMMKEGVMIEERSNGREHADDRTVAGMHVRERAENNTCIDICPQRDLTADQDISVDVDHSGDVGVVVFHSCDSSYSNVLLQAPTRATTSRRRCLHRTTVHPLNIKDKDGERSTILISTHSNDSQQQGDELVEKDSAIFSDVITTTTGADSGIRKAAVCGVKRKRGRDDSPDSSGLISASTEDGVGIVTGRRPIHEVCLNGSKKNDEDIDKDYEFAKKLQRQLNIEERRKMTDRRVGTANAYEMRRRKSKAVPLN